MTDTLDLDAYLARGGKLTSPDNVTPRYRAELMRIMATFVDSELAGAAGFAEVINDGPGIAERVAAARIVMEKTGSAGQVLRLMGEFGVDTARYAQSHPWSARLAREADIGAARSEHDMRLAVFNYPLEGWADAVVMNLLMGTAVGVQLDDLVRVSYQPLAQAFRDIRETEAGHVELAAAGLARLVGERAPGDLAGSVRYWWPRVADSFGQPAPDRMEALARMGLRRAFGDDQRAEWAGRAKAALEILGLKAPG